MSQPPRLLRELKLSAREVLDPKRIGAFLRELRERVGPSQYDHAAKLGVPYQNLSRLEHGRGNHPPLLATINRYVEALGWEIEIVFRPKRRRASGDEPQP
jgi:transcriptional regulator with XRE-family HTH domain